MTPDAPLQLTRETGFHPRTSALTRAFGEYRGFWVPQHFAKTRRHRRVLGLPRACRDHGPLPAPQARDRGPRCRAVSARAIPARRAQARCRPDLLHRICYEHGGMVDDGTLFRLGDNNFRWIGGDDASLIWIKEQAAKSGLNVLLKTATNEIHNVAVQGPMSRDILREHPVDAPWPPDARRAWPLPLHGRPLRRLSSGIPAASSREPATRANSATRSSATRRTRPPCGTRSWRRASRTASRPFGFEALDMVRIEAGLALGGYEFCSSTDPFEAGIGFTIPSKKEEDYIGKAALERRRATRKRSWSGSRSAATRRPPTAIPSSSGARRSGS